ncbi:sulfotransferase [Phycicoccus endophyticus]|uniref:Sulfotransferase n=1 Tax=Phycicoccus endophyticus TaxID=1690220 RepID=A0A7G9R2E7_9MICO|nr:sulfotransferase [Phycicoccus endophyticus]NHI20843.1 sulfotransferase [Phycicoccus endophyticus]QNN49772.1 sulfotransferase [Phycicoccus endophyticus]GGL35046.1 sulfotransferase [Phycicoccus endophyticus]
MADQVPTEVTVLYIGGMPRGGTTLLDLMIGQLPEHVAVGELFYVWLTGVERDRLCGCGRPFHQCEFWQSVGEEAFGGWDQVDLPAMKRLVARVDRSAYLPLLLAPSLKPGFREDLAAYQDTLTRLYRAVAAVSGCRVVVDSSKRPSLAYALRTAPGIDLRVAHIVRDPRGVVQSWSKEVALPEGAGANSHLKRRSARLVTRRWMTVHSMIESLGRLGVPMTTLRYEDLVVDPHRAAQAVAALTDTPVGPDTLGFLGPDGLSVRPHHTVAGGRIRFHDGPMALRLDERWRREMPSARRRLVAVGTWPMRRRYGYE